MQAQNTFNEGMVLDNHPLMTPNTVLTDALNATLVTMNGNEMVLQNDMGNARVENAKLPPGYIPIGMKEYGGIIYIACYNPLTNKGQIGCFPSPQRQKTATQISEVTPTFKFPDITKIDKPNITFIEKEKNGEEWYKINSLLTKCEIFPKGTIIRSGDKFSVGLPITSMFGNTNDADYTGGFYISNYNNVENKLVKTPMNRMYTFGVATLDNNGQLRDITNQLKRYDGKGQQIQFLNTDSDLYKFNCGYWQNEMSTKDKDGLVSSELMDQTSVQSKLNTYNSKLFGRLFLYAKYNAIDNVDVSVVGYKQSEITNEVKNPIYSNPNDSEDKKDDKNIIPIDYPIVLFIYANYKYNCPDGSGFLNGVEVNGKKLVEPYEGYKYYFDKPTQDDDNIIRGLLLTLNIGGSTTQKLLEFSIPNYKEKEQYKYKCYTTGYGYPVYDPITNLYSFSQLFTVPIKSSSNQRIEWNVTPIMRIYDGGLINGGQLPDKGVSGSLDTDNINSGVMKLNTWNYYVSGDRVNLRWGYESYPRDNDVIRDITFNFYDIASDKIDLKDDGTINPQGSVPRWTYITKNRLSYNGTFSENFDINNFISNKASNNIFAPNKLFYVRISYYYNDIPKEDYRWLLLTGLYNPSYWGDEEYSSVQDYNDFLKCYYTSPNNKNYYIYQSGLTEKDIDIQTEEGYLVITSEENSSKEYPVGGWQYEENKSGAWVEVTDTKEIEDITSSKQRIPEEYYNMKVTASLKSTNTITTSQTSSGKFISTNINDVPPYTNETYQVSGSLNSTISLNNDVSHALNISKWIPTIKEITAKHTSNIEYEGVVEDSQKLQIDLEGKVNTSKKNNTITTTYTKAEFKTLFGGDPGACSMRVLSSLSTLPELRSIAPESFNTLNQFYAVHTYVDVDGHNDFKVSILPISTSEQYSTLEESTIAHWKDNSYQQGWGLVSYNGKLYNKNGISSLMTNSSFKEQFDKLPKNYNIIVLGSLPKSAKPEDSGDQTNNTSIVQLKTNKYGMQYDASVTDRETEYTGRIFVLIRNITGEFTLVNYIDATNIATDIDFIKEAWKLFIGTNIAPYNYYNPEQVAKVYSIIDNWYYSKAYKVFVNYNVEASISNQMFKKDYLSILEKFQNSQVMTLNLDINTTDNIILNDITVENVICTIPSAKHLIADITNNTSIFYIQDGIVSQYDSDGNPLTEDAVYSYDITKGVIKNNQLKIKDNTLYTYNVGSKLNQYPKYGWSSMQDRWVLNQRQLSCCTATLGGINIITLNDQLMDIYYIQ